MFIAESLDSLTTIENVSNNKIINLSSLHLFPLRASTVVLLEPLRVREQHDGRERVASTRSKNLQMHTSTRCHLLLVYAPVISQQTKARGDTLTPGKVHEPRGSNTSRKRVGQPNLVHTVTFINAAMTRRWYT